MVVPSLRYYYYYALPLKIIVFLSSHVLSAHFSKIILQQDHQDCTEERTSRTFGLFGLTCLSLASTVGSGTFVLGGLVAAEIAGPAGIFSWALAALGSAIVATSYAELACCIPASGGPYAFVYNLMGEVFAVMVCWLISLEFGVAGAALSRAWAEKLVAAVIVSSPIPYLENILAAAMVTICSLICARGLDLSKRILSFFVVFKVLLLVFISLVAFSTWDPENLQPFAPFGFTGVLKGGAIAFFGFIGFDEPCVFAAEAIRPNRDLALSMVICISISASLYFISSLGLSGTLPYNEISTTSTFMNAFTDNGLRWAGIVSVVGQLVIFPSVVLASVIAQPKIFYILARDGMIPSALGGIKKFAGFDQGDGSP